MVSSQFSVLSFDFCFRYWLKLMQTFGTICDMGIWSFPFSKKAQFISDTVLILSSIFWVLSYLEDLEFGVIWTENIARHFSDILSFSPRTGAVRLSFPFSKWGFYASISGLRRSCKRGYRWWVSNSDLVFGWISVREEDDELKEDGDDGSMCGSLTCSWLWCTAFVEDLSCWVVAWDSDLFIALYLSS